MNTGKQSSPSVAKTAVSNPAPGEEPSGAQEAKGQPDNATEPTVAGYTVHPAASIFPLLPKKELEALAEDIRLHGLIQPIRIYKGMMLDGRNRALACERAQVELRTEALAEDINPVDYVVGANLHRRQLSAAERAVVAVKLMPFYREEAAERKRTLSGTRSNPDGTQPQVPENVPEPDELGEAREQAAKAVGVNAHYVTDLLKLQKESPPLFNDVAAGKMTIPGAMKKLQSQQEEGEEQEVDSKRKEFLAVLWDDAKASPTRAPEKSYDAKIYPNLAFFRFYKSGGIKMELGPRNGLTPVALFAVPVESNPALNDRDRRAFCRASCRFLVLSVRGTVPNPSHLPLQIIENGYEGVTSMVAEMFPNAFKAVNTTRGEAPSGWELVPREPRAGDSPGLPEGAGETPPSDNPPKAVSPPTAVEEALVRRKGGRSRKPKPRTVGDHARRLHEALRTIRAGLIHRQKRTVRFARESPSYEARRYAIKGLEDVIKKLARMVAEFEAADGSDRDCSASIGALQFSTQIVMRGTIYTRLGKVIEILRELATSVRAHAPAAAQGLENLVEALREHGNLEA